MSDPAVLLAQSCPAVDLKLELLDPGSVELVRLFKHPGGEWAPPPPPFRNLRVDPPAGHKDDFAVLYTGDNLPAVAVECQILSAGNGDQYVWRRDAAAITSVARYRFTKPALFLPIDGPDNARRLGLAGSQRPVRGYAAFQSAAWALHQRFGGVVHGLSWASFHRNQPGRVYALWHDHKATIGLEVTTPGDFPLLVDDAEWASILANDPDIEMIDGPGA